MLHRPAGFIAQSEQLRRMEVKKLLLADRQLAMSPEVIFNQDSSLEILSAVVKQSKAGAISLVKPIIRKRQQGRSLTALRRGATSKGCAKENNAQCRAYAESRGTIHIPIDTASVLFV